jgi:hypothetical protein
MGNAAENFAKSTRIVVRMIPGHDHGESRQSAAVTPAGRVFSSNSGNSLNFWNSFSPYLSN